MVLRFSAIDVVVLFLLGTGMLGVIGSYLADLCTRGLSTGGMLVRWLALDVPLSATWVAFAYALGTA